MLSLWKNSLFRAFNHFLDVPVADTPFCISYFFPRSSRLYSKYSGSRFLPITDINIPNYIVFPEDNNFLQNFWSIAGRQTCISELHECSYCHIHHLPADKWRQVGQLVESRKQQQWGGSRDTSVISCAKFVDPCVPYPSQSGRFLFCKMAQEYYYFWTHSLPTEVQIHNSTPFCYTKLHCTL